MYLKEKQMGIRKTFFEYRIDILLILLMVFVPPHLNFGQLPPEFFRLVQPETNHHVCDSLGLQGRSFPWGNDCQINNGLPERNIDKAASGFISLLDSVYEVQNFGYYKEQCRWYYQYDEQQRTDSVWRYFYNPTGEFEKITEIRTFNSEGQIIRFVKWQPDFQLLQWYGDSTIIEYYTEEYIYQQSNLIKKISTTNSQGIQSVTQEYHTYDSDNRLIRDSLIGSDGYLSNVTAYIYNSDNDLEYVLYLYEEIPYGIRKYEYEKTDTSKNTTEHWNYYSGITEYPILDTITYWQGEHYYYETFDQQGRRITLRVEYDNIYEGEHIDYMAEYTYTPQNDLLHISYYNWIGDIEAGYWEEASRINNTYDDDYNLQLYEKTFYDARTEMWETENSKTYYYTDVPVSLPEDYLKPDRLVIFPNPATDVINIKNDANGNSIYKIYNLCGLPLESGRLEDQKIVISQLKPGIYLIEIRNDESRSIKRFIKY
jgi:hypothetical protein